MEDDLGSNVGVLKLRDYLTQTRRQAELAIDNLNAQIQELSGENVQLLDAARTAQEERDYYKNLSEQYKTENSKKWRLAERDDWKALVESVQRDRNRLQDDLANKESELHDALCQIEQLKSQISNGTGTSAAFSPPASPMAGLSSPSAIDTSPAPPSGASETGENVPPTPRTMTRELKTKLEQSEKLLDEQKRASEFERLSHVKEIGRLRHENRQLKGHPVHAATNGGTGTARDGSILGSIPIVGYAVISFGRLLVPYPSTHKPTTGSVETV